MAIQGLNNTDNYVVQLRRATESQPVNDVPKNNTIEKFDENRNDNIRLNDVAEQIMAMQGGEPPLSEKTIVEAIEKANKAILGCKRELRYSVHDTTGEVMVKVLNSESGEVIREIPSEKILDLVASLWELAGILVDEKK